MLGIAFTRVIFLWMLGQFGKSYCWDEMIDRVSTLEERVHKLEGTLGDTMRRNDLIRVLASDIIELTNFNEDTDVTIGSTPTSTTPTPPSATSGPEDGKVNHVAWQPQPITLLEVRREMVDSTVKFTIKYEKVDKNSLYVVWRDDGNKLSLRVERVESDYWDPLLGEGIYETSVLVPPEVVQNEEYFSQSRIIADFQIFKSGALTVGLRLEKVADVQTNITLPSIDIQPSGDFIYEEGQDFIFNMTTPPPLHGHAYNWPDVEVRSFVYDSDEGEVRMDKQSDSIYWETIYFKKFPDHQDWSIKFKTSERNVSGIFEFAKLVYAESSDSLIVWTQLIKTVILRPSSQEGPFPDGHLSAVQEPWTNTDVDGAIQSSCSIETTCSISCIVAGPGLLDFSKNGPDGKEEYIADNSRFSIKKMDWRYIDLQHKELEFKYDPTVGDTERFSCLAMNSMGMFVSKKYVVKYYLPMQIITEESRMELLPKVDSTLSRREIKVICQVKGRPRPKVTFTSNMMGSRNFGETPDDMIVEGNDVFTFVKHYDFDPRDPRSGNVTLLSATCESEIELGGYQSYDMELDLDEEV